MCYNKSGDNMIIATINANDKQFVREMEEKREIMLFDRRNETSYESQDFMLVRATNHLENDRFQRPLFHTPFIVKNNNAVLYAVQDILDEQEHIDLYQESDAYYERSQMIKQTYLPYSSQYRSTVHFAVNGLVSSHAKGDFSNRNFIILDNLAHHLKNNDIRSFRMEDTYMYGDVSLSMDAVIMIRADKYEELILQFPQLEQFNIVLYIGSETKAVELYLTSIGIISEKIGEHGADEHRCSNQIRTFRMKLKNEFGIDSEPHCLSKEYESDDKNSLVVWDYYKNKFYSFFLNKIGVVEPEYSVRLQDLMDMGKEWENKDYIKMVIKKIGLESFKRIVDEYNLEILNSIAQGTFQNNEEIVTGLVGTQK